MGSTYLPLHSTRGVPFPTIGMMQANGEDEREQYGTCARRLKQERDALGTPTSTANSNRLRQRRVRLEPRRGVQTPPRVIQLPRVRRNPAPTLREAESDQTDSEMSGTSNAFLASNKAAASSSTEARPFVSNVPSRPSVPFTTPPLSPPPTGSSGFGGTGRGGA